MTPRVSKYGLMWKSTGIIIDSTASHEWHQIEIPIRYEWVRVYRRYGKGNEPDRFCEIPLPKRGSIITFEDLTYIRVFPDSVYATVFTMVEINTESDNCYFYLELLIHQTYVDLMKHSDGTFGEFDPDTKTIKMYTFSPDLPKIPDF